MIEPKRVLHPPSKPGSPFLQFYTDALSKLSKEEKERIGGITELSKKYSAEFNNLSSEERQRWDGVYAEKYEAWKVKAAEYQEKYTPQMIIDENHYRRMQRLKNPARKKKFTFIVCVNIPFAERDQVHPLTSLISGISVTRLDRSRPLMATCGTAEPSAPPPSLQSPS